MSLAGSKHFWTPFLGHKGTELLWCWIRRAKVHAAYLLCTSLTWCVDSLGFPVPSFLLC